MRNPNPNFHGFLEPWRFLIKSSFVLLLVVLSSSIDALAIDSEQNHNLEWQILTKTNFTSQIQLHHHVLLMVTVPWSGESRSLMKKVADAASYKLEKLDNLRLMVLYRDKEKMLADALGVTEETTIFFYSHTVSYKYQGRLRAQNILSSVDYIISSLPEELPLKLLNTPEELNTFIQSTDKAVLLFEFCGWTSKLLGQGKNNGTEYDFLVGDAADSGIISGANCYGETRLNLTSSRDKNQKGLNNEKLICDTDSGLGGIPWLGGFTTANHSASSETEKKLPGDGLSCTFDEFQQFESFFSKFMTFAREFFLPPERQRFGLVSEKYLLSSLGVGDPDLWLAMIHFAGCSNCSKIIKKGVDLKTELSMQQSLITELERKGHDVESALPGNRPSAILFVDRSSESLDTKRKSMAALEIFRKLALHNQHSYRMAVQNSATRRKPSDYVAHRPKGGSSSDSIHSSRDFSQLTKVENLKNKMSVMIINEDGNIASDADAQGRSIQDILSHLLRQRNEAKLSYVAKEVGFQLLSDDFEVKLAELLEPQAETSKSDKVLLEASTGNKVESGLNLDKENTLDGTSSTPLEPEVRSGVTDSELSPSREEKITYIVKHALITSSVPDQMVADNTLGAAQDLVEGKSSTQIDKLEVQQPYHGDLLGFYFSDGGYHLLNSLTSRSEVPSMIIIDPISEQHFIYPQEVALSYSSLQAFLDAFINGSLIPYQRSEPVIVGPREATQPPFINLDFREVDSIPQVTAHTFSELVLGFNQSENNNIGYSWNKDVMVLFSNGWCGFCQRMELVVREVFRAFKGYLNVLKSGHSMRESTFNIEVTEDAKLTELPLIFSMDCTLNDCSALLKSMGQREVYPTLLLFPAQRKTAISYQGDMSVNNVMKFLIANGSNSHHLNREKGILWTAVQKGDTDEIVVRKGYKDEIPVEDASPALIRFEEDSGVKEKYHEVVPDDRTPTRSTKLHTSTDLHDATPNVVVGSVLIATDKLQNAPPFDKSMILIVQANQSTGFQGLIINKRIGWESFEALNKGSELVKKAPLSFGGPLIANGIPLVSLTRRVIHEGYSEVHPSVYFLDQSATVGEIEGFKSGIQSTDDYWFFLGYSSWGWEQLFAEIAEGAWQISDDPMEDFSWPGS